MIKVFNKSFDKFQALPENGWSAKDDEEDYEEEEEDYEEEEEEEENDVEEEI